MPALLIKYWIIFISFLLSMCGHPVPQKTPHPERHIAVLCYHHVDFVRPTVYSVRLRQFDQHIQSLQKAGFTFVSLAAIENYYYRGGTLPEKSVALTFDDANKNVYTTAYPYLKKRNIPFAVFAYPTTINKRQSCSWRDLRTMAADGVSIGSHAYWHPLLTSPQKSDRVYTPEQYAAWLELQTAGSKKILEEKLGVSVNYFALPFGAADTTVLAAVKNAGYTLCFNVTGGNNSAASDPLNLNRTLVYAQTGPYKLLELASARNLPATVTPGNMHRMYDNTITLNISVKNPQRYTGPWLLELSHFPVRVVSPNVSGNITVPLRLSRQGFYMLKLWTKDGDATEYCATSLFIYTKKKPSFIP